MSAGTATTEDDMITTRPATAAEIAADAHLPAHKRTATVETNTDGRATVGRANTIHRAEVIRHLNEYGDQVGGLVLVGCGAERYRNARSRATAAPQRYEVDCARCAADGAE
jgi:hypothetical protein